MPNDLLTSDCFFFADDSKLYSSATHFDIQRDIGLLNQWTIENEMTFNADICKVICFNSNLTKIEILFGFFFCLMALCHSDDV